MEQQAFDKLLARIEEYIDLTPGKLAREYCRRVAPGTNPAVVRRSLPKGYLVVELLRREFSAAGKVPRAEGSTLPAARVLK